MPAHSWIHTHSCSRCPSWVCCVSRPEDCPIQAGSWTCPRCEFIERDAATERLASSTGPEHLDWAGPTMSIPGAFGQASPVLQPDRDRTPDTPPLDGWLTCVRDEVAYVDQRWVRSASSHEGYAVLLEEVDDLWAYVKTKRGRSTDAYIEAVQIAAMALRYLLGVATEASAWRAVQHWQGERAFRVRRGEITKEGRS